MAGKATIIIQGTAWGVRETQNGKRYLSVSVSPGYRDRNGNWKSQPEHYYSVWPAGYANLNPVFDQIAQLRQNQDQFVDVTIVGEVSGCDAYTNKNGGLAASCSVSASAVAITNVRQKGGGQSQGYGAQGGYTQQPQGGYQPSQPPASDPWANGSSVTYNVTLMADELAKLDRYKLGALP